MLSRGAEYAIRALSLLAVQGNNQSLHTEWVEIRKSLYDLLEKTTLADVAARAVRQPSRDRADQIGDEKP
jgi:DNA-binding IscR family transcriptional regulator